MANTTLTQTGAQVQSILNKADKLPATVGTSGQVLTSDGTNLSWQTPSGGLPTITVAASQVISQDPIQIQLTQAQCDVLDANQQVNFNVPTFGNLIMFKIGSSDSDIDFTIVAGANSIPDHVTAYHIEVDKTTLIATYYQYTVNSYGVDGTTIKEEWSSTDYAQLSLTGKLPYLTTAPSSANNSGTLEIVVLSSEPATKYDGYLYLIKSN